MYLEPLVPELFEIIMFLFEGGDFEVVETREINFFEEAGER